MPEEPVELLAAPGWLWRVHRYQHGPLNPPPREGTPDGSWSRFDVAGCATIYGATDKFGAYEESLASFRPADTQLDGLFDDADAEAVDTQWQTSGHMLGRQVARQWRDVRRISSFGLRYPASAQIIDISHSTTLSYLRATLDQWATPLFPGMDPSDVDVAAITGQNRVLTCAAAWWLQRLILPDGTVPDGLGYRSRHGVDLQCFAFWVDLHTYPAGIAVDAATTKHYTVGQTAPIQVHDPDLQEAAKALHLVIH